MDNSVRSMPVFLPDSNHKSAFAENIRNVSAEWEILQQKLEVPEASIPYGAWFEIDASARMAAYIEESLKGGFGNHLPDCTEENLLGQADICEEPQKAPWKPLQHFELSP